jgi:hypothetical protein
MTCKNTTMSRQVAQQQRSLKQLFTHKNSWPPRVTQPDGVDVGIDDVLVGFEKADEVALLS